MLSAETLEEHGIANEHRGAYTEGLSRINIDLLNKGMSAMNEADEAFYAAGFALALRHMLNNWL